MKMGADATDCVAGVDGSVYNLYPKFPEASAGTWPALFDLGDD